MKEKETDYNNKITVGDSTIFTSQCFDKVKTKGRPKKILNSIGLNIIEKLASFMCTEEEIASFLDTTVETLHTKDNYSAFLECIKKGQEKGRASLRMNQFRMSKSNPTMAIWLGKQYLEQKDVIETKNDSKSKLDELIEAINNAKDEHAK
jgi:hypothetical protein